MRLFQNTSRFDEVSKDTAFLILHNPRIHYALSSGLLKTCERLALKAARSCGSVKSKSDAEAANLQISEYNKQIRSFLNFDQYVDLSIQRAEQSYELEYGPSTTESKKNILTSPIGLEVILKGHGQVEYVSKLLPVDIGTGARIRVNGTVSFLETVGEAQAADLAQIMQGTVEQVGDKKRVRFQARFAESSLLASTGRTDVVQCAVPLFRADELMAEGVSVVIRESRQGLLQLSRSVRPGTYTASLSSALKWSRAKIQIGEVMKPSSSAQNLVDEYKQAENNLRSAAQATTTANFNVTCPVTAKHLRQIKEAHAEGGYDRAFSFLRDGQIAEYYELGEEDASSVGFIRGTLAYMRRTGME